MPTEGVPGQPSVIPTQRGEPGSGEPAALVVGVGVWLLNPSRPAATADLVVHAEDLLVTESCRPLAPICPLDRDRVLPRRAQLRHFRPAALSTKPPTADPPQDLAPGLAPGRAPDLVGLGSETSCGTGIVVGGIHSGRYPSCCSSFHPG